MQRDKMRPQVACSENQMPGAGSLRAVCNTRERPKAVDLADNLEESWTHRRVVIHAVVSTAGVDGRTGLPDGASSCSSPVMVRARRDSWERSLLSRAHGSRTTN